MEIQMNEGYIIIDSIYIGGSGFVLGVSSSIPNMYVTWEHINGKYYNGRYTGSMLSAKRDLLSRATNALERMERKNNRNKAMNLSLPRGERSVSAANYLPVYSL